VPVDATNLWQIVVAAAVGAVTSYLATRAQETLGARRQIDVRVLRTRLRSYPELWRYSSAVPRWPRNSKLTYEQLEVLSKQFRAWYFESGGMYLSRNARKAYGAAQESLASCLDGAKPDERVTSEDYDRVQIALSALRTELTRDVLSRTRPLTS
jgi:hypothetical protein